MSEALDYLFKVRPQAMEAYFRFMKLAGTHLDPKTRAIISVITKVEAQTEAGFRQYLKRALDAGVTANEVLDALLMAFPMLGLTRILWAIDLLLEMDLPEFQPSALDTEPRWHDLGELAAIGDRGTQRVNCDGRDVFVHRLGGEVRVYDARCPHQQTLIPESGVQGTALTCPRHGWCFSLEDGQCRHVGGRPLVAYPARVEAGRVLARW